MPPLPWPHPTPRQTRPVPPTVQVRLCRGGELKEEHPAEVDADVPEPGLCEWHGEENEADPTPQAKLYVNGATSPQRVKKPLERPEDYEG